MSKKIIYLSMKYADKKVNLSHKELAVRICVRTEDEETGQFTFEYVSAKEALKLVSTGVVELHTNSETKTNLRKASEKLLSGIPFGRRLDLTNKMSKLADDKGSNLNWLEKVEQYIQFTGKRWNKAGIRI